MPTVDWGTATVEPTRRGLRLTVAVEGLYDGFATDLQIVLTQYRVKSATGRPFFDSIAVEGDSLIVDEVAPGTESTLQGYLDQVMQRVEAYRERQEQQVKEARERAEREDAERLRQAEEMQRRFRDRA